MVNEGRYDHLKKKPRKDSFTSQRSPEKPQSEYGRPSIAQSDVPNYHSQNYVNAPSSTTSDYYSQSTASMHERLNMRFFSKVFQPDTPLFLKMGTVWELEARLQEIISLMVPEASRSGNPLLKNYANQIADLTGQLKVHTSISYLILHRIL